MSLKVYTLDEFSAELDIHRKWVIEPFGFMNSVMMLYGGEGLGKSRLLTQLSHSVITGQPWLGFPVHTTGPVLFMQLDMPRMEQENLIESIRAAGMYEDMQDEFFLYTDEFDILDKQCQENLKAICAELNPVMVILDTAYQGFSEAKSNILVRKVVKSYSRAIYPALFTLAHHKDKKDDMALGFGEWGRVVTTSLRIFEEPKRGKPIALEVDKCRLASSLVKGMKLDLMFDQYGFLRKREANMDQLLLYYPLTGYEETMMEVFESIGGEVRKDPEAVRSHYYKAVKGAGITPDWIRKVHHE